MFKNLTRSGHDFSMRDSLRYRLRWKAIPWGLEEGSNQRQNSGRAREKTSRLEKAQGMKPGHWLCPG